MSVVHIKNRITDDQKSFDENSTSDKSLLWLSGEVSAGEFSIDLRVGGQWSDKYGPTSNEMHTISTEGLRIQRHGSVVVEASENIRLPHNMYGILVPTGSLFLDKGILIAPAKVEPSFTGNLKLRLFNTTAFAHTLTKGEKIGSVIFFSTETTQYQQPVTKSSILISKPIPVNQRIFRWLKTNATQLVTWLISLMGGSMMAALLVHFVIQPYFPTTPQTSPAKPALPGASAATSAPASAVSAPLDKKTP